MSGWLHGIAWGPKGLGIICIWYGTEKASRSLGSVVPRNVYYPKQRRELTLRQSLWHDGCGVMTNCRQRALSEIGHE
jgi:hypothetical protein